MRRPAAQTTGGAISHARQGQDYTPAILWRHRMSIQALGWVLDHSPTTGTDRLVLIALANHASKAPVGDAWEAWPGVATIAREAGLARNRTVQESLARLEEAGAIERHVNGAPDTRIRFDRRPNLYRILLSHGVTPDSTPSEPRGDAAASNGVTPERFTGCSGASPEPKYKPKEEPLVSKTPKRRTSFPEKFLLTETMREWAKRDAPNVDMLFQTRQFADYWRGKGERRADWEATWRTWMRNAEQWNRRGSAAPVIPNENLPANLRTYETPEEYAAWQASKK